jgi:hypothetical protein
MVRLYTCSGTLKKGGVDLSTPPFRLPFLPNRVLIRLPAVFPGSCCIYSTSCSAAKPSSLVRTFTTRATLYTKILPSPM